MRNTPYGGDRSAAVRSNTVPPLNISCDARVGAVLASVAPLGMSALRRPRGRVLVVDDDAVICEMLATSLAEHGYETRRASDGRETLYLVEREAPDVLLLDVHLPDISGGEVLAELQADAQLRRIPVVMISADAIPATIGRFLAQGAGAYLTKPLDVKKLLTLLDERLKHPGTAGKAEGSPQRYSS